MSKYEVRKDGLGCMYIKEDGEYKYAEFSMNRCVRVMGGFPSLYRMTRKQRMKFARHVAAGNSVYLTGAYAHMKENNKYLRK